MHRPQRVVFALLALPAIARAVVRLVWLERRLPLETLVTRMRTTGRFRVVGLARPEWLLATVDRLLPVLPPWRYGPCLKRSLLLLDLWSRCGLYPRFHLGVRREDERGRYQGHAWVSVGGAAAEPLAGSPSPAARLAPSTSSQGYPEAFVL